MNNNKAKLSILFGACALASVFTGCQDYDAGYTLSQVKQSAVEREYSKNFISEYGDLSDVKSWDLSSLGDELNYMDGALTRTATDNFSDLIDGEGHTYSYHPLSGCTEGTASAICETSELNTTIASVTQSNKDFYYLPAQTFTWLTANMTENQEHTSLEIGERSVKNEKKAWVPILGAGHNFKVKEPESDFWLLPIYQGAAVSTYDLHLVMDTVDYKVWTKGQGLQIYQDIYEYTSDYDYIDVDNNPQTCRTVIGTSPTSEYANWQDGSTRDIIYYVKDDNISPEPNAAGNYVHEVTFWADKRNGSILAKKTLELEQNTKPSWFKERITLRNVANTYAKSQWVNLQGHYKSLYYNTLQDQDQYVKAVRSKPIHFKKEAFKGCGEFFFYLEITTSKWNDEPANQGKDDAAIPGTKQRSDKGMMAALAAKCEKDIAAITGKNDEKLNAIILGCEAANRSSSDYDYNDVVFLMIGNPAPTILETFDRRYLCEDLGSTYDFDFNDIVVDVHQRQDVNSTFKLDEGEQYVGTWDRTLSNKTQSVSIAHMCGTIPFQVYIGDTVKTKAGFCFPVMTNPNVVDGKVVGQGYSPTSSPADVAKYCLSESDIVTVEGEEKWWNPATNNVYIDVWPSSDQEKVEGGAATVMHTVAFPADDPGERGAQGYKPQSEKKSPQMIAVDPLVNWLPEHEHIPTAWVNAARTLDITNIENTSSSDTE